ncbi:MAG: hypothetical protein ISP67_04435 [Flavobacteriaceae bacterium]|nr:hypothetical protein [Flavobacteriaceae bacterium]
MAKYLDLQDLKLELHELEYKQNLTLSKKELFRYKQTKLVYVLILTAGISAMSFYTFFYVLNAFTFFSFVLWVSMSISLFLFLSSKIIHAITKSHKYSKRKAAIDQDILLVEQHIEELTTANLLAELKMSSVA